MTCLSTSRRVSVISALVVERNFINAACRMTGVAKHTVLKLLKDMGCAAAEYHNAHVRNLRVRRIQTDEIWAFVYGKDKNPTLEQVQAGAGSVWTWTAIDADTKLIVSYMLGDRGASTAQSFMRDVAGRITNRIQLTTEGHRVYAEAVEDAFGADIDYAMLVKICDASNDNPESRCSPATCIGYRTGVLAGSPDTDHRRGCAVSRPDEWFQEEVGESRTLGCTTSCTTTSVAFTRVYGSPGNGSGVNGPRLNHGRTMLLVAYRGIECQKSDTNLTIRRFLLR